MKICVCGYYYRPEFIQALKHIKNKYEICIVSNKNWNDTIPAGIKIIYRENIGLEWGAYNHYLHKVWDGEDVLFMHDDIRFKPVIKDYKFLGPIEIVETIERLKYDQVYFFNSTAKAEQNYYIHGRALKCSGRFLEKLKEHGGFPYDKDNSTHTRGPTPKHCKHFNWADYEFADFIKQHLSKKPGWKVGSYLIIPALECATRGRFDNEIDGPMEVENERYCEKNDLHECGA